jgi:hypothetical protein
MVGMPFNLMIGIMTLIGGGVMERYPKIKFVFWKSALPGFPIGCGAWTITIRTALIVCPPCQNLPAIMCAVKAACVLRVR